VTYEQFDAVFRAAARKAFASGESPATAPTSTRVPYDRLWRATQLGFDAAFGRETLANHDWLVFVNRMWDAHRTGGVPDGPARVPEHIWELADRDDATGRLHRDLLAATGMRLPDDVGEQLDVHLTLWRQDALVHVLRGVDGVAEESVHADGPVAIDVTAIPTGFRIEVRAELAGTYAVTLHWPDRTLTHVTPPLAAGAEHAAELAGDRPDLPQSVVVTRRSIP